MVGIDLEPVAVAIFHPTKEQSGYGVVKKMPGSKTHPDSLVRRNVGHGEGAAPLGITHLHDMVYKVSRLPLQRYIATSLVGELKSGEIFYTFKIGFQTFGIGRRNLFLTRF